MRPALFVLFVATALGLLGQVGQFFPAADAVNHYAPIWIAIGLVGAAIALLLRPSRAQALWITAVSFVLIAILARMVLPDFLASARHGGEGADLTLVQFNAMKENAKPAVAAAWIIAQRADVVTIEEARESSPVMRRLRETYPFQTGCLDHDRCSTAILTREAPLAIVPLAHGDPDNRGGLSAIGVIVLSHGVPTLVIATHFNRPWPFEGYDRSLRALTAKLHALPPMPTVLAGDFNMTPWTFAMARQDRAIAMPRLTRALPTWPATLAFGISLPVLPIDHVYARGLHALRIVRGPPIGSDHLPLRLELKNDEPSDTFNPAPTA